MYKVKFIDNDECSHKVLVCNRDYDRDYHTSSPLHFGVCLQCKEYHTWEIRHMDYVVVGSNAKIKFPLWVKFESVFEYNKEYTEEEVVKRLIEIYEPDYIMNGRRCLYHKDLGINKDILWQ